VNGYEALEVLIGMNSVVMGVLFGVAAASINCNLKKNFKEFYDMYWWYMVCVCFGLSVPMILNGSLNILMKFPQVQYYIMEHFRVYQIIGWFFCYILPIGCQLNTLVFGYLRGREEKKETYKR
jgi:hypothetical protein